MRLVILPVAVLLGLSAGAQVGRDATRLSGTPTDSYADSFTTTTSVYDRARADLPATPDPGCGGATADATVDGTPLVALRLEVTTTGTFEAVIVPGGTSLRDTVLYLYCDPFDPLAPLANMKAVDDDDGGGPSGQLSAFTAADGIVLTAGTDYWLVLTTFNNADLGSYQIDVAGATISEIVPVEIQSFVVE